MLENYPQITIVIPLYNHERFISHALKSIYNQTILPKEVIVIDDGSRDASLDIAKKFAKSHPETTVWSHPNQGAHYTINFGIHQATSEFVAILNSDDIYLPNRLAECLVLFDADPELSAVCTGISFIDEKERPIKNPWYEQALAFYNQIGDLSLALINGNFFMTTSNLIVRRTVFDEIGYFSALRYAHDLDFLLRLLLRGKHIHFHEKPLLNYRIHPSNTINENMLRVRMEWAAVVSFYIYNRWKQKPDWDYYAKLTDITDRHSLTRLMIYFFTFFESLSPRELSSDAYTRDNTFQQFLIKRDVK